MFSGNVYSFIPQRRSKDVTRPLVESSVWRGGNRVRPEREGRLMCEVECVDRTFPDDRYCCSLIPVEWESDDFGVAIWRCGSDGCLLTNDCNEM